MQFDVEGTSDEVEVEWFRTGRPSGETGRGLAAALAAAAPIGRSKYCC